MFTGILQLVLIQNDVEHLLENPESNRGEGTRRCTSPEEGSRAETHRGALGQLVRRHQLHVQMFTLGLPPRLNESLEDLWANTRGTALTSAVPKLQQKRNHSTSYLWGRLSKETSNTQTGKYYIENIHNNEI